MSLTWNRNTFEDGFLPASPARTASGGAEEAVQGAAESRVLPAPSRPKWEKNLNAICSWIIFLAVLYFGAHILAAWVRGDLFTGGQQPPSAASSQSEVQQ